MTFKYHVVLPNNCVSRIGKYLLIIYFEILITNNNLKSSKLRSKTYVTYIILKKDDFDFSSKYFFKFLMMQFMDH